MRQLHGRVIGHLLIILLLILSSDSKANKLTVVAEQLVPYQYQEQDQVIGLSVKLIEHVLQGADLKADINIYPWSRALMLAQTQPNTIILTIVKSPERSDSFHWIGKITEQNIQLVVNKHKWQDQAITPDVLEKMTIAVPRSSHQQRFLTQHPKLKNNHIAVVNNKEQAFKMLLKGRVDAVSGEMKLLRYRMKSMGLPDEILKPVMTLSERKVGLYIAMSKNSDPALVQQLTDSFNKFAQTDEFKHIQEWRSLL